MPLYVLSLETFIIQLVLINNMLWALFSFVSAISQSTGNVFIKKLTSKLDIFSIFFSLFVFWTPIMICLLIFSKTSQLSILFIVLTFIAAILVLLGNIFYFMALKTAPLSLAMPVYALTPFFAMVFSIMINKEIPNIYGVVGTLLIVVGCYSLNLKATKNGIIAPLLKIFNDKGTRFAFFASLIFGISLTIDKFNIKMTNTFFYFSFKWIFLTFIFLVLLIKIKINFKGIKSNYKQVIESNFLSILSELLYMVALGMCFVAYVTAIKRSSVLFDVVYGHFIFKEKETKQRFIGASIIVIGLILITFFSR